MVNQFFVDDDDNDNDDDDDGDDGSRILLFIPVTLFLVVTLREKATYHPQPGIRSVEKPFRHDVTCDVNWSKERHSMSTRES